MDNRKSDTVESFNCVSNFWWLTALFWEFSLNLMSQFRFHSLARAALAQLAIMCWRMLKPFISFQQPVCNVYLFKVDARQVKRVVFGFTVKEKGRFTVEYSRWPTHSPATLDVTGSRPNSGDFSEIYFLESIQPPAQRDLKWSVWHCRN